MSIAKTDPLLLGGKVLVILLQILLGMAVLALAAGIPVAIFSQSHIVEGLADGVSLSQALPVIIIILILALVVVGSAFWFLQLLRKMIDTVGQGDPFVPENATRLSRMAWIILGIQVLQPPITACVSMLTTYFPTEDIQTDAGISLMGIVLAVVLFILARVFRKGTEMREDLEGTV